MATKGTVFLVILLLVLENYEARGIRLSEEKLDLGKQYKLLKKPSIKTIKTKYGDIYDCVDFYKQPAFDHPLLKNHTFHPQMKPSFVPELVSSFQEREFVKDIELKDKGCPEGTVPIRRMSKKDFIKARRFTEDYASRVKPNYPLGVPGDHYAVVQTKSNPSTTYKGVGGSFSLHTLPIKPTQYSSAGVTLQNGNDHIQVGWTAGPSHCFNTQCPGFVQVGRIPIDNDFGLCHKGEAIIWMMKIMVYKDPNDGNWWLALGHTTNTTIEIVGFWPPQIFTTLTDSASYVAVGGNAYGPLSEPLPPMGCGYYPVNNVELSAFCGQITVLDSNYQSSIDPQNTETSTDTWQYGVFDMGMSRQYKDLGRLMFYGGTISQ